jgi:hypothetical protein
MGRLRKSSCLALKRCGKTVWHKKSCWQDNHVAVCNLQAMCKGVSWHQPFVQLLPAGGVSSGGATAAVAAVVAAAGGRDQARPQGCFTVVVQPQLPLIKVSVATSHVLPAYALLDLPYCGVVHRVDLCVEAIS